MKTGAKLLVESLQREGVDTLFGYPGGQILPVYDELYDSPLRHILVRHEQAAAHAADGYARASVRVGVGVFVANQPGVPARLPVAHRAMSARPATIKSPARTPINAFPDFFFLRYEASGL